MAGKMDGRIWVWGGPTESWGGSMEKEGLAKGAAYFQVKNVLYVYGPHTDEMLATLCAFDKVVCQIGSNCRNPGAQNGDSAHEAQQLSLLSLRHPNIVGAVIDDFDTGGEVFTPAKLAAIRSALRLHNPNLLLHVVTYSQKEHAQLKPLVPFLDVVTVWVWDLEGQDRLAADFKKAKSDFPGKPIYMGVFLHDYGTKNDALPLDILSRQLDQGRQWLEDDFIQGLIILGDREIKKHPEQAALTRKFLEDHFINSGSCDVQGLARWQSALKANGKRPGGDRDRGACDKKCARSDGIPMLK